MKLAEFFDQYHYEGSGKGRSTDIKSVDLTELLTGIAVEKEHYPDINKRASIAADHLTENPHYYSKLIKAGLVDEQNALEIYKKLNNIVIEQKVRE
jgi:hypothetical protein